MAFRHPVQHERRMQAAVIRWARSNAGLYPPLRWLFAIPNGGSRDALEAMWLKKEGVTAGVFDLCLLFDNGEYPTLWMEMKHGKNTLTADQLEFKAWAESQGHETAICYTPDEAIQQLRDYLGIDDPWRSRDVLLNGIDGAAVTETRSTITGSNESGRAVPISSPHRSGRGRRG